MGLDQTMKVTSHLLSLIGRGWAQFTSMGPGDTAIDVPPVFLNGGVLPQPTLRILGAGTADTWNVSTIVTGQQALATTNNVQVIKLSEGLWRVHWQHNMEISGAVSDLTAVADFTVSVISLSGSPVISRLRDSLTHQHRSGDLIFSVLKGQEIVFNHTITGGAGTSTQFARIFMQCSRLL